MAQDIPIRGDMIRLGQLLKLADVVDSGSEVKAFLAATPVLVNGERDARRGRQLHPGDTVHVGEHDLHVVTTPVAPAAEHRPPPVRDDGRI
jgi:ribosome-associated protein